MTDLPRLVRRIVVAVSAVLASAATGAEVAPTNGERGSRPIVWTVPFPPGGGSGAIAEFLAPLLSKYLPGHPVVQLDYEPGSGSIRGANLFTRSAAANGRSLIITTGSTQIPFLLGDPRVRYTYQDWRVVMAMPTGGVVYASPKLGLRSWHDIRSLAGRRLTFANQGATSLDLVPLLAFKLLGLDVQHVFGFKGRADAREAFERGEVDIDYQTTSAYLEKVKPLVDAGRALPLFSFGATDGQGNLARDPTFPDLPHFGEVLALVRGDAAPDREYEAYLSLFTAGFVAQKMVFVPKDTPPDAVEAYHRAFEAIRADPEYQRKLADIVGRYEMVTGPAAEALLQRSMTLPADGRRTIVRLLATEYGVKVGR